MCFVGAFVISYQQGLMGLTLGLGQEEGGASKFNDHLSDWGSESAVDNYDN